MSSNSISPNHREILSARSTITGKQEYLTSTSGVLNVSSSGGGGGNVNLTQVGGASIALGQTTMSASLPVTIASNQASIPVAATLSAETTKVIGVTRTADGAGNLLTSTGNALDVNLKTPATLAANMTQLNGVATSVGNGTTDTGTQRVTISSDSTGQVNITDGTNKANILKSDGTAAGQNSQLVAGAFQEKTGNVAAVGTIIASTDVSGYTFFSLQLSGFGSATVQVQFCNDNTTFSPVATFNLTATNSSTTSITSNGTYTFPKYARYMKIVTTAWSSGTIAGTLEMFTQSPPPFVLGVNSTQSGTWTVGSNSAAGSALPANVFSIGSKALTTSPTAASTGNLVALTADTMGEMLTTSGGLVTTSVPANASNVVVKGSAGRLCRVLVTTTGVTAMQIFDNATTNSGTIIGALPASAAIGGAYDFEMPAANGITIAGSATNPAVTVSWI